MRKNINFIFLTFSCLLLNSLGFSQNPYSSIQQDSSHINTTGDTLKSKESNLAVATLDTSKTKEIRDHSARKATLFSTALPGLGQAYNKKYWKIPIVYAGFGAMAYFFTINNSRYLKFKNALIIRNDGDESTIDKYATQYPNQQTLIEYKDYYQRNRDLSIIGFALFYVLNIVDANVDANLYYFDVSDDLSFQWSPILIPSASMASGISLKMKF
jgi:Family of unknown function (DUF5683)